MLMWKNAHSERQKLDVLTPEERFANHKGGTKAAWAVKRHGLRLLPELYEHLNPMPYEAAAQMEKDLAEGLRRVGYTVTGGHQPIRSDRSANCPSATAIP
jgi:hypothetical protein